MGEEEEGLAVAAVAARRRGVVCRQWWRLDGVGGKEEEGLAVAAVAARRRRRSFWSWRWQGQEW